MHTQIQYLNYAINKGWDKTLLIELMSLAGGYDMVCEHAAAADELIFLNSMADQPDLDGCEPDMICTSKILINMDFLGKEKTGELADFFKKHHASIKQSLLNQAKAAERDALVDFAHLTWYLDDEDVAQVLGDGDINDDSMRYALITVYYELLVLMADMQGRLDGTRLAELDLSKIRHVVCNDAQLVVHSKPTNKKVGFDNTSAELLQIYKDYFVSVLFEDNDINKQLEWISITRKDESRALLPINLLGKAVFSIDASKNGFIEADITSKKKEGVLLHFSGNAIADITLKTHDDIEFHVQDSESGIVWRVQEC